MTSGVNNQVPEEATLACIQPFYRAVTNPKHVGSSGRPLPAAFCRRPEYDPDGVSCRLIELFPTHEDELTDFIDTRFPFPRPTKKCESLLSLLVGKLRSLECGLDVVRTGGDHVCITGVPFEDDPAHVDIALKLVREDVCWVRWHRERPGLPVTRPLIPVPAAPMPPPGEADEAVEA